MNKCVVYYKMEKRGKRVRESIKKIVKEAEKMGYEVVGEYIDDKQGPQEPRKQLMALLSRSMQENPGYSAIIVPAAEMMGRGKRSPIPCVNWLADNGIKVMVL